MKISTYFALVFLFTLSSTGCQKQEILDRGITQIYFPTIIVISLEESNLFFPIAISDDPDIEFLVEKMEIFDRYGNPMYRVEQFPPNDSSFGWDGTVEGEPVESGTFSYSIKINDGIDSKLYQGDFTVIR